MTLSLPQMFNAPAPAIPVFALSTSLAALLASLPSFGTKIGFVPSFPRFVMTLPLPPLLIASPPATPLFTSSTPLTTLLASPPSSITKIGFFALPVSPSLSSSASIIVSKVSKRLASVSWISAPILLLLLTAFLGGGGGLRLFFGGLRLLFGRGRCGFLRLRLCRFLGKMRSISSFTSSSSSSSGRAMNWASVRLCNGGYCCISSSSSSVFIVYFWNKRRRGRCLLLYPSRIVIEGVSSLLMNDRKGMATIRKAIIWVAFPPIRFCFIFIVVVCSSNLN
mmetsp:Transcript_16842/g.23072  ORF Transcript_16842/g.23072 Transcript_16842/m.23072 type:complete len:279 (+) Transcript_16842:854-1690(+)